MKHSNGWAKARNVLSVLVCLMLVFGLSSCKPTDFFTEVIITSQSEVIDENNQDMIRINNPDANQKTDALSSLTWTDESKRTEATENLVVWSDEPNSTMTTHHSRFDLSPRFPGILASDGVRVTFDKQSSFEYKTNSNQENDREDVEASGTGRSGTNGWSDIASSANVEETTSGNDQYQESADNGSDSSENDKGDAGAGNAQGNQGGGDASGGSTSGNGDGSGASDDPGDDPGHTPIYAGYDGSVKRFDPKTNAFAEIPTADSVAVIGNQVAVLVQALGGKGAICAMSAFDYYGGDEKNINKVYYKETFAEVFGSRESEWDSSTTYLWNADTSSDFSSISGEMLVERCGVDGVVLYDQSVISDIDAALSDDVKRLTFENGIQFMPVDLRSLSGLHNAAELVGQVLKGSSCANNAEDKANKYRDTITSMTSDLGKVLGSGKKPYVSFATDAEQNLQVFVGSDTLGQQIVLFADYDQDDYKPLNSLISGVGLQPLTVLRNPSSTLSKFSGALSLMCPLEGTVDVSRIGTAVRNYDAAGGPVNRMSASTGTIGAGGGGLGGLGSRDVPYLIVCGSSDGSMSAIDVAGLVEENILQYVNETKVGLYSAFKYGGKSSEHEFPTAEGFTSNLGGTVSDGEGAVSENPLIDEDRVKKTVRANPVGCLGSWSGVSFESILEAAWLAAVYSEAPDGSQYQPKAEWGNVTANVGGTKVKGSDSAGMEFARSVSRAFYKEFYRLDDYTPEFDE